VAKVTKANIQKFVKRREGSQFNTNLQVMIDASECNVEEYIIKQPIWDGDKWIWDTPWGEVIEDTSKVGGEGRWSLKEK
jgi:hypothetical protein